VLIAIRAVGGHGTDLVELTLKPPLNATAQFAIITLAGRSEAPALAIVRRLMQEHLQDGLPPFKTPQPPPARRRQS
jgi:hypothetical protein